jgi:IS5 family transposase
MANYEVKEPLKKSIAFETMSSSEKMHSGERMKKQLTFAEAEYENRKHKTRREKFLERMEALIPWAKLASAIAPFYPQGGSGRPPYALSMMLRIHCMQLIYNLSDPAMEDALDAIESMRRFAGVDLSRVPDESTILHFRHLLEQHDLGSAIFKTVNDHLAQQGLLLKEGSIVDATIITAPSSTKNATGKRDLQMRSTQKGRTWYFGMKMHIGVDAVTGLMHHMHTTPANVHDLDAVTFLLHGEEKRVYGDAGYRGIHKRKEHQNRQGVAWHIALRPSQRKVLDPESNLAETHKARIRAKVEHPFRYIKQIFGYAKVRYRGLHKNTNRLALLAAFTNLLIGSRFCRPQHHCVQLP